MLKKSENFRFNLETRDIHQTAKERLEQIKPLLRLEADRLRKYGAPVDDETRIDMNAFSKIGQYEPAMIQDDLRQVAEKEKLFISQNRPEELLAKNVGELLEVTKTILFNKYWFKKNFIALRTSKFDDYHFGIDELIFDTATFQPLAVIDTSTIHKNIHAKVARGGQIKYGLKWEKKGFRPSLLAHLPVFVVQIKNDEVLRLAREVISGELSPENQAMEKSILTELKNQSETFGQTAPDKIAGDAYREAATTFEAISKIV